MLDKKYMIAIGVVLIILAIFIYYKYYKVEKYSDLMWAAGLPGQCSSCSPSRGKIDYSNPNLMEDTLIATMKPYPRDYYGRPAQPIYFGTELPEQLYGKIWNE